MLLEFSRLTDLGDVVGLNTFNRARKAGDIVADELGG